MKIKIAKSNLIDIKHKLTGVLG